VLYFMKTSGANTLLVAINLDPHNAIEAWLELPLAELGLRDDERFGCDNLVTGEHLTWRGGWASVYLDPHAHPAAILRIDGRTHG
jgi:starch synthase (maltosyl-transferring)